MMTRSDEIEFQREKINMPRVQMIKYDKDSIRTRIHGRPLRGFFQEDIEICSRG